MKYLKSTQLNGERDLPDEEVDEAYVERYVGKETVAWFRDLGGREELHRRSGGVISLKSTSPDGKHVRLTVFTPIREEPKPSLEERVAQAQNRSDTDPTWRTDYR